jgi:hypothetical protein
MVPPADKASFCSARVSGFSAEEVVPLPRADGSDV